jgi:phenylalanyl-tRNA synthetase beta chain
VRFRPRKTDAVVGLETPADQQHEILRRLGFEADGKTVTVPTWRARDVTREIDVVEEVARFRLDDVPARLPVRQAMFGRLSKLQRIRRKLQDTLVGFGYSETYTWSLLPDDPDPKALRLQEPLSSEQAVLRTSLLPGLIASARRNVDVGNEDVALFELAHVYLPSGEQLPDEHWHVGGIVAGGFALAKGTVEGIYSALGVPAFFDPAADLPGGASGARTPEGWVLALREPDLTGDWGAFELDVDSLAVRAPELVLYDDVISYPPVRQDLAFVVEEDVPAGDLVAAAQEAAGPELREMRAFDVYRGEQAGPGRKSIAFSVTFQSPERTLTDEDAAALRNRIVERLQQAFGAQLRA